ncbi:hypothetical protein Tco_1411658 [Tanacetum coccineum]
MSSGTLGMAFDSLTCLPLKLGKVLFARLIIFVISVGSLSQAFSIPNLFRNFSSRSSHPSMLSDGNLSNHALALPSKTFKTDNLERMLKAASSAFLVSSSLLFV